MPDRLEITPDKVSYGVVAGNTVGRTKVQGGASRYRRDLLGANPTVRAQWTFTGDEYGYFMLFWRAATQRGALPFTMDIFIESASIAEHTCYFIPDTLQLVSQSGDTFVVAASLEVELPATDTEADELLIAEYGDATKLELRPDQTQYLVAFAGDGIRSQLDGGAGRYRRGIRFNWHMVTVQWTLTPAKFDYLMAFRRTAIADGSIPFDIDLILDSEDILTYKAYIIPESFQLVAYSGLGFTVTAQLEVEPKAPDDAYELSLLMLLDTYGDDAETFLNMLEQLVNVDLNAVA